jgi:hypothetical protein
MECVVLGWLYRVDTLRAHANERSDWRLGKWWNYAIRIFIPIVLGTLFLWSLFDDFTNPAGFFRDAGGEWIVSNCVGISVMCVCPVIAVLMSMVKSPARVEPGKQTEIKYPTHQAGRPLGLIGFALSSAGLAVIAYMMISGNESVLLLPLFLGIAGVCISNYVLDKYDIADEKPSGFARWGGIFSIFDISAFLAMLLIRMTKTVKGEKALPEVSEKLSGVSYVILGVVFLMIVVGLGWCFYRAITASAKGIPVEEQLAEGSAE